MYRLADIRIGILCSIDFHGSHHHSYTFRHGVGSSDASTHKDSGSDCDEPGMDCDGSVGR